MKQDKSPNRQVLPSIEVWDNLTPDQRKATVRMLGRMALKVLQLGVFDEESSSQPPKMARKEENANEIIDRLK